MWGATGAATCRGTLDANPERHKDYGRNVAVLWDDGTYYPGVVTKFNLKVRHTSQTPELTGLISLYTSLLKP